MKPILSLLAGVLLALPGLAQGDCSSLSITATPDPVLPKQTVDLALTGTLPNAPVLLALGSTLGTTTIRMRPYGTFTLDLQRPFSTQLLGFGDVNGDLSRSYTVPSSLLLTMNAQAVGMGLSTNPGGKPVGSFCISNAVTFDL